MHILVAPDAFGPDLTAAEAGVAIATGWARSAPDDTIDVVPMSAGGPGFVEAIHHTLGGELLVVSVAGPAGDVVPATILRVGSNAYLEAAQACSAHLIPSANGQPDLWRASSYGVGQLIAASIDAGATKILIGLAAIGSNDGGAGLLSALGALPSELRDGPGAWADLVSVDLRPARSRLAGVHLVAATDVDNPLLGLRGTTNVFGPARGATPSDLQPLDAALTRFAELAGSEEATKPGAGAGGGIGYALALLGSARRPVLDLVVELVDLTAKAMHADLVITATQTFDGTSLRGAVVAAVATTTNPTGRPSVVLAERVEVGRREMNAYGIESAYAIEDLIRAPGPGGGELGSAAGLAALAERVARSWSPRR